MINLERFINDLNDENLNEMKKINMPFEWAYNEYLELLKDDPNLEVNNGVKEIIIEYLNGLLYKEFNKYELDWE